MQLQMWLLVIVWVSVCVGSYEFKGSLVSTLLLVHIIQVFLYCHFAGILLVS